MHEVLEAVKEASISIACCLDEVDDVTQQDLEHIQKQITIIENYLEPFTIEELENIRKENENGKRY
jgi:AMMECR1 domain-containing protein